MYKRLSTFSKCKRTVEVEEGGQASGRGRSRAAVDSVQAVTLWDFLQVLFKEPACLELFSQTLLALSAVVEGSEWLRDASSDVIEAPVAHGGVRARRLDPRLKEAIGLKAAQGDLGKTGAGFIRQLKKLRPKNHQCALTQRIDSTSCA